MLRCNRAVADGVQPKRQMMSADDDDVTAVLAGDVQRFEGIVLRWQGPLLNLAFRFVRDRSLAEELAQEAFVKCFRSLRQWRREARFSTWLFSVALSVYRSKLRRLEPVFEALRDLPAPSGEAPDERLAEESRAESVRRAVASLPPLYRDPLIVFYFQEQDLASTARLPGLREGTVKARLHRAREALRGILTREIS